MSIMALLLILKWCNFKKLNFALKNYFLTPWETDCWKNMRMPNATVIQWRPVHDTIKWYLKCTHQTTRMQTAQVSREARLTNTSVFLVSRYIRKNLKEELWKILVVLKSIAYDDGMFNYSFYTVFFSKTYAVRKFKQIFEYNLVIGISVIMILGSLYL